jgi:hypothetical protein
VFRAVPRRIVAGLFVVCTPAIAGAQQQGSVQLSSDTQIVSGNGLRQAGEETIEPDAAVLWTEPGTSFGAFQLETHLTRRGDELHVGRTWLTFHDVKAAGLTWSFEGGDLYNRSDPTDYQFSNLTSTTLTFTGGFVTARSGRTTIQAGGGRSNALLNIFGTDAQALGQTLGLVRATVRPDDRWTLNARAVRTRTSDLGGFTRTVDASDQAGGGARFIVTPSWQLVADASYVRYRATGSAVETQDYSYVAGSHLLLGRGSVELNATRFSPGDMPVLSATMQDRSGIFASMDYDVSKRAHVFAGWESADTNINPSGTAILRPEATSNRGFGGIRLRVPGRSTIAVRLERGGRIAQPVAGYPVINGVLATQSDTGSYSAEWQTSVDRLTAFTRFSIRNNIDVTSGTGTFTQRETSGQVFYDVSRRRQVFAGATIGNEITQDGGHNYIDVSGGLQQQLRAPALWMRLEATASQNRDRISRLLSPRSALSAGLNGQLTRYTSIGINVYVDRAPVGAVGQSGWLTRSMIRVVHTIPTGEVRLENSRSTVDGSHRARGGGSIVGTVFADWNGNGIPDPGEDFLAGIPVRLGASSSVTTSRDGQFSFVNIPPGTQDVGLDLNALPVDFDPPPAPDVSLEVARGETRRVALALIPLGTIAGRVVEDANKNGRIDPDDPVVDGIVISLDGGARSEMVHNGRFVFSAVRAGDHRVELLKDSLPDGAAIVGETETGASITRDHVQAEVTFLVRIEKRPEIRKKFRGGGGADSGDSGGRQ